VFLHPVGPLNSSPGAQPPNHPIKHRLRHTDAVARPGSFSAMPPKPEHPRLIRNDPPGGFARTVENVSDLVERVKALLLAYQESVFHASSLVRRKKQVDGIFGEFTKNHPCRRGVLRYLQRRPATPGVMTQRACSPCRRAASRPTKATEEARIETKTTQEN
jgi:hypothetical protein